MAIRRIKAKGGTAFKLTGEHAREYMRQAFQTNQDTAAKPSQSGTAPTSVSGAAEARHLASTVEGSQ